MSDSELLEPSVDPKKRVIGYRNVVCENPAGGARTVVSVRDTPGFVIDEPTERGGTNAQMTKYVGIPICRALLAFSREDYDAVVDLLQPVRYKSNVFGGSYAQRDVIALTLIEAAIRAGRFSLAHALLAERTALKETSPMTWKLMARTLDGLGDRPGADSARGRAESLLAGIRPTVRDNTGLRDDPVFIPGGCLL